MNGKTGPGRTGFVLLAVLLAVLLGGALAIPAVATVPPASPDDGGAGILLGDDVVLAPAADRAFVTEPGGRVAALDLDTGAPRWRGPARGRPFAVHGGWLWVLAVPAAAGELVVEGLDPETGEVLARLRAPLPDAVLASPFAQPASRFDLLARSAGDGLQLHWHGERRPLRGALLEASGEEDGIERAEGVLVLDAGGGQLAVAPGIAARPWRRPDLPPAARLAGLPGTQFASADGAHVLTAAAEPDDALGVRWRWRLARRHDGGAAGSLLAAYPTAPFQVRGSSLLWREEPVVQAGADGRLVEAGVRLLAADLATGRVLWTFALADPVHRLPPPP